MAYTYRTCKQIHQWRWRQRHTCIKSRIKVLYAQAYQGVETVTKPLAVISAINFSLFWYRSFDLCHKNVPSIYLTALDSLHFVRHLIFHHPTRHFSVSHHQRHLPETIVVFPVIDKRDDVYHAVLSEIWCKPRSYTGCGRGFSTPVFIFLLCESLHTSPLILEITVF